MLYRIVSAVLMLCVITACDRRAVPTEEAALDKFCHARTFSGEGIATPEQYRICRDHFRIDSDDAENWYITGVTEKWPHNVAGFVIGMPTVEMNKTTGKTRVVAIAD